MRHRLKHAIVLGLAISTAVASTAAASGGDRREDRRDRSHRITVNTRHDTVDARPSDGRCADRNGKCSLRAAVQTANAGTGAYEIDLRRGTYRLDIGGTDADGAEAGDLDVLGRLQIDGHGAVIDLRGFGDRAFDIAEGADVSVKRLAVRNAELAAGASGGAVRNAGALHLWGFRATDNTVTGAGASGGAILNSGSLDVTLSHLSGNRAARAGGAIEADGGTTTVALSVLAGNMTGPMPGNGGAIHLTGPGDVRVIGAIVQDNVASAEGGGLWNSADGSMTVSGTVLKGNVANGVDADQGGGGLFNDGGSLTVSHSSIRSNSAPSGSGSGGGVLNNLGDLTIRWTTVADNDARRAGGGIETVDGSVVIERSTLEANETGPAPGNGGAVHASGAAANVSIDRSRIIDNVAALEGGGLWAGAGSSVMTVTDSTVRGNVAKGSEPVTGGGGLFNKGGRLVVDGSSIVGNSANEGSGSGGGILNLGTLVVTGSAIDANAAARAGGGIESNDVNGAGDAELRDVSITGNSTGPAPGNGGGVHVTGGSITTLIDRSRVVGNDATNEGGGLWNFAGATMTVTDTTVDGNDAPVGPNVFQNGDGGNFTVDGTTVPPGDNDLAFP